MRLMRSGVVALAVVGILGAAAELATARHWKEPIQLVPWVALGVLAVALVLLAFARGRRRAVTTVRLLAVLVLLTSGFGVYEHVASNYDAGPLDGRYLDTWEQLPLATRWWYAASKTVGPAPPLAAGVLGYAAALVLLGTVGLRREDGSVRADGAGAGGD